MKNKNKEFASDHLYRIFVFEKGKNREHDLSIRAFQDFLHQKGVDYSIRALYDFAEGKLPFPAALLPELIEFSKDQQLINMFLPSIKSAILELNSRLVSEERALQKKMQTIRQAKEDLSLESL
ncbi:MAG: hypothetical protein AB1847_18460 [bacterium]